MIGLADGTLLNSLPFDDTAIALGNFVAPPVGIFSQDAPFQRVDEQYLTPSLFWDNIGITLDPGQVTVEADEGLSGIGRLIVRRRLVGLLAARLRFEDFVLDQERTLERLEGFLGLPLTRIPVNAQAVGRYRNAEGPHTFPFFADDEFYHLKQP